jgi:peptide/nickel transport system ATP-binding protein
MSILFISHDLPLVSNISNRMAVMYAGQIVEMGESQKIISSPSHPYTKALIQSIPNQKNKNKKLEVIDGIVPSPKDYPIGCHFYQRCNQRLDRCKENKPLMYTINKQQQSACFLKEKKNVKSKKS